MAEPPQAFDILADKMRQLKLGPNLDELRQKAKREADRRRASRAGSAATRGDLFIAAERLRFRLLLSRARTDPRPRTKSRKSWSHSSSSHRPTGQNINIHWIFSRPGCLEKLRIKVLELLFLWIATIDQSLSTDRAAGAGESGIARQESDLSAG